MTSSVWTKTTCQLFFKSLGKMENIMEITNCATRLRVKMKNDVRIDKNTLLQLPGVKGIIERRNEVHLIIGWEAGAIKKLCSETYEYITADASSDAGT
ncbi:PTS transporter subunit EIIB [Treponema brennaborense]|uniref:Phosphotransferase system EIIB/cysteine, phosphorylation site n=1 Tax=Treponema brennaborense (strain DSM 12168 / CIP 105900 / DD5/3) TaxID=906968 RepID=F4LLZ5_TREBD|nr:PTS transporter subunit EIIB [Treponema brennaborense]AEE15687.1 Phosphotransferase system EIIB/cysteine, phosphorylation site [Treponema brennaborense DSM 12168]